MSEERKIFRDLVAVEEALQTLYEHAPPQPVGVETVQLWSGVGRVLAYTIHAKHDVPNFDRSAMDGYAVRAEDTYGAEEDNPIMLTVVDRIKAGYVSTHKLIRGEAIEVATGAPIPFGADCVIMVEDTDEADNTVSIYRGSFPGEHIQSAGTDLQLGEQIHSSGTILGSKELAKIAAAGIENIEVYQQPKVCVFSSGDEVIPLNAQLQPGKLHDINSTSIVTALQEIGAAPHFAGILMDKYEDVFAALQAAITEHDMILISGGTSAGIGDMLFRIVDQLGEPGLLIHGIKLKPGKPTIIGVVNQTPIIGLPGFPASAMSVFNMIVQPYVRKIAGLPTYQPSRTVNAVLNQRMQSVMGRLHIRSVQLIKGHDGWIAYPNKGTSGAITTLSNADGYIEIPIKTEFIDMGTTVTVHLTSDLNTLPDLQITGSHCLALVEIQNIIQRTMQNFNMRILNTGSTGGLSALQRQECHIAGSHLPNFAELLKGDYRRIIGYKRRQGLLVPAGNPKNINGISDLVSKNITFLNRNPGSGTRILLDALINEMQIDTTKIKGYTSQARSHTVASQAVRNGLVDVAIGIETVAIDRVDFVFIAEEEYDFFVHQDMIGTPQVQAFINVLRSKEFADILLNLKGYEPTAATGNIVSV